MIIYVIVALGLNVVVGLAGLLDLGYVGFYAIGAYTVAVLSSKHANLPWLLCAADRHRRGDALRRAARRADAAPARRLPGDRHARLRRDHPPARPRSSTGSARPAASPTSRYPPSVGPLKFGALHLNAVLLPRPDLRDHHLLLPAPAGEQPGRAGLDGDPRGRGRRRADGRADVQVQAVGVRHRRRGRRLAGALYADQDAVHQPEQLRPAPVDPVPRRRGARRPRQHARRHPRRRRRRRTCPSGCASSTPALLLVRRRCSSC